MLYSLRLFAPFPASVTSAITGPHPSELCSRLIETMSSPNSKPSSIMSASDDMELVRNAINAGLSFFIGQKQLTVQKELEEREAASKGGSAGTVCNAGRFI